MSFEQQVFNRQGFTVRLVGGERDGQTLTVGELTDYLTRPPLPRPFLLAEPTEEEPSQVPAPALYRRTGSVAEDGAHLYSYYGKP